MTALLIRAPSNWYEKKLRREIRASLQAYMDSKRNPDKQERKAERRNRFLSNGGGE